MSSGSTVTVWRRRGASAGHRRDLQQALSRIGRASAVGGRNVLPNLACDRDRHRQFGPRTAPRRARRSRHAGSSTHRCAGARRRHRHRVVGRPALRPTAEEISVSRFSPIAEKERSVRRRRFGLRARTAVAFGFTALLLAVTLRRAATASWSSAAPSPGPAQASRALLASEPTSAERAGRLRSALFVEDLIGDVDVAAGAAQWNWARASWPEPRPTSCSPWDRSSALTSQRASGRSRSLWAGSRSTS